MLGPFTFKLPGQSGRVLALLTLLGIVVVGAYLRLRGLTAPGLWFDEWITVDQATRGSLYETVTASTTHPPLFRLLVRLSIALCGAPGVPGGYDFAARLPSALLGTLAILFVFLCARRLADGSVAVGLLAAAAYAFGPWGVYYSQEARFYAATVLFSAWTLHATLRLREAPRDVGRQVYLFFPLVLGLYNHHLFAVLFVLSFFWIVSPLIRDLRRSWPLALPWVAAGLLFLPWFAFVVTHLEGQARPWIPDVGEQAPDVFAGWFTGRIGYYHLQEANWGNPYELDVYDGAVVILAAGLAVHLWRRRLSVAWFVALVTGLSLTIAMVLHDRSATTKYFHHKYLAFLYPVVCLVLAELVVGIGVAIGSLRIWPLLGRFILRRGPASALWHRDWLALGALWLAIWALWIHVQPVRRGVIEAHHRMTPGSTAFFHRERYREIARFIEQTRRAGSVVVVHDPYLRKNNVRLLRYYGVQPPCVGLTDEMLAQPDYVLPPEWRTIHDATSALVVTIHGSSASRQAMASFVARLFPAKVTELGLDAAEGYAHAALHVRQ